MIDPIEIVLIHQLLGRYGHLVDARDWEAFSELFVEDASIDYIQDVMQEGFQITAPNAEAGGACGCGGGAH